MDKQIPIYFDTTIINSPIQEISSNNPNIGRLKVRAFTKYENRNGSYITDRVAEQLIESAVQGNTPVVGFFDPSSKTWASHTGPTLANGYGYIEEFLGWEPFTDTDGITRDYAVFSVILFTEYFKEAQQILGQNQSMELDVNSISGEWSIINGESYYVYSTAKILGFCVIGSHEPCFSVSAFFSKSDSEYKTQYEKFSSMLEELKANIEKSINGGEQPMNEEIQTVEVAPEETSVEQEVVNFEETAAEVSAAEPESTDEVITEVSAVESNDTSAEPTEFEVLQQQFNELQNSYNELQSNYEAAQNRINELEETSNNTTAELEALRKQNEQFAATIAEHENKILQERKESLFEKYEKIIDEEEISLIREQANNYSYEELESKLAIAFANKQMAAENNSAKVPLPEPPESQFALLMKKYRKN